MQTPPRGKFQGVLQIVRFNWPLYVAAFVLLTAGALLLAFAPLSPFLRAAAGIILFGSAFWLIVSLVVSHYVYDRSQIYDDEWIRRALPRSPSSWANFHAGFDEFCPVLTAAFPSSHGTNVDFFDPVQMTEPSIKRARRFACRQDPSLQVSPAALPFGNEEMDALFVFFSAHELRRVDSRLQFFTELRRVLKPAGRMILLEHLRDVPNFLAFGPGFLHFHSRRVWSEGIAAAHLTLCSELHLTPFVRAFILEKRLPDV